ncbi:MAG: 50S ribosomal protein P1 [Candidatus Micrarchaeaceae archaeon]
MEYVYAALLLNAAGKEIDEKSLMEIVKSAGITPDEAQAKAVASSLKGVDIKEVLKNAQSAPVAAAPAAAPQHAAEQKPKKEEKSEKSEEEAVGGLSGLFG